ncbi:Geranylgeranyltransferase_type-2 subunit beta [Hexamita inflata]|uniref:Geranylgeranyl transferase type II subunit beta n=1 Tax=Hexamita inflata TaxID=28002 RepID=A0ABP1HR30_9EUKA
MDNEKVFEYIKYVFDDANDEFKTAQYMKMFSLHMITSTASVLGMIDRLPKQPILDFIMSCYDERTKLFSAYLGGDGHILYTFNALTTLLTLNSLDLVKEIAFDLKSGIQALQHEFGYYGDLILFEVDSRFTMSAVGSLYVLKNHFKNETLFLTDSEQTQILTALLNQMNPDGGFGASIGQESHAANLYCALGSIKMMNKIHQIPSQVMNKIRFYLIQRQTASGGFNGRPEKQQDTCYVNWCGVPLKILGLKFAEEQLKKFVLSCQDGGFADRPEDEVDLFHTHFCCLYLMEDKVERVLGVRADLVEGWD